MPVRLGGAAGALEHRLEFHLKTYGPQIFLEWHLLFIPSVHGLGPCAHQFTPFGSLGPKCAGVKTALLDLPAGVVDLLHIDKDTDFFQMGLSGQAYSE